VFRRRFLLPAAALLALALPAPASAIVHGAPADQGEYPAQGYLKIQTGPTTFESCGGTLVGSRQFLTAARCTTSSLGVKRAASSLTVFLGNVDLNGTLDEYAVTDNDKNDAFVRTSFQNDAAMLTLARPAPYAVTRVVSTDAADRALWAPDKLARVIGWGAFMSGNATTSDQLLEADVPVITDARCAGAYPTDTNPTQPDKFYADTMVCAADPLETSTDTAHDTCFGDEGGPLLVPDGGAFALAGIVSWRGSDCGNPQKPGVYTRIGDDPLNKWVHDRTPEADFGFDHAPRANEAVTLFSTSRYPPPGTGGDDFFDTFKWDLDEDGEFDDATGKRISHIYATPGGTVVGIEASNAEAGDKASAYFAFDVGPDPNAVPPALGQPPGATPPPPATTPRPAAPRLATISAAKRPKVRRGHFRIRVKFAKTAPRGTAVIEVFRGKRIIGIARTRVRRGATKRVNVKLTTTGRRLLRRSATKRLKVRVRVRVGRRALRSKTLTIRR
jgi:secreted trypsin-like serine protease